MIKKLNWKKRKTPTDDYWHCTVNEKILYIVYDANKDLYSLQVGMHYMPCVLGVFNSFENADLFALNRENS